MAIIISQNLFTGYGDLETLGDWVRFQLALEGMDDEPLMKRLEAKRGNGRDDYPIRMLWNLVIAMKVFGHKSVASLRREASRNSQMRRLCGLDDYGSKKYIVPPARVFTGFFKLLANEQEEIDRLFTSLVIRLSELLPSFGESQAGDGKYLDSYAKHQAKEPNQEAGNRAENDAAWSVKEYRYKDKNGKVKVKKEYHFGFKAHIICDVETELPIAYNVLAANIDEKKAMMDILNKLPEQIKERGKYLMLDRGYDSLKMIQEVKNAGLAPIVDIRNMWKDGEATKQYKDTNMVYDYQGNVYYVDELGKQHKMNYEGYDKQKKCLRYSYKGKTYKIYISYDERVFLPVARSSAKFKRLYKGRTAVERLNGRLDRDFMFEDHFIRGLKKMKLMAGLTLLIMNAMAVGKIQRGITENLAALTKPLPQAS